MQRAPPRVVSLEEMAKRVMEARAEGKRVAHCHGCFDILHWGHLRHFEAARALSDMLVVTVTPDAFVNKGPNRPVFPAPQRAELLAGLRPVDLVAINRWPSAVETLRLVRPTYFVKGSEYETDAAKVNPNFYAEAKAVEESGGTVLFTREDTASSTSAFRKLTAPSSATEVP
jgi:rfaE bifunctional protein nucleotidyltransferase chain/domain